MEGDLRQNMNQGDGFQKWTQSIVSGRTLRAAEGISGRAINGCRKLGLISAVRKRHESKETIAEQKMG